MTICSPCSELNERTALTEPHDTLVFVCSSHLPKRLRSHDESEFYRCNQCQSVMMRKSGGAGASAAWQFVIGDPEHEQWS